MASELQNELSGETSPYLLEHAADPVAWLPWGARALQRAREQDKPIFLSIGYSACHWCHVMQRESFQSERVARVLNEHYISIKVDREERPDLDELYLAAVLQLTGSAGWPLSVFLTPQAQPFFGGTYFPPVRMYAGPSFLDVIVGIAATWQKNRSKPLADAARVVDTIVRRAAQKARADLDPALLERSSQELAAAYDALYGGFGDAPKFPRATDLRLCLRHALRTRTAEPLQIVQHSLECMARGGIHDQLGGGFHRYSTDERWLVPHFEKMLYDNALLCTAYLEGYLATGNALFAETARGILEWAEREMLTAEGAFAGSLDADSAGLEGSYYVWTPAELRQVLGARPAAYFGEVYGVSDAGNYEQGASVLWRECSLLDVATRWRMPPAELQRELGRARQKLLLARARRTPPARDDKLQSGWNGLWVSALALAAQTLEESRYAALASQCMHFVLSQMRAPDGRLYASWRAGCAKGQGSLSDHAYTIQALLDLYETDFDAKWVRAALALARLVARHFGAGAVGGYYDTADDSEALFARLAHPQDGALPSAAGVQVLNLLRLAQLSGDSGLAKEAEQALLAHGAALNAHPAAFGQHLLALDYLSAPPYEIVLSGAHSDPAFQDLLHTLRQCFLPQRVIAHATPQSDLQTLALLRGKTTATAPLAWICRNWSCSAPTTDLRDYQAKALRPQQGLPGRA